MQDRIIDLIISLKSKCLDKEESIRTEFGLSPAEYRGILAMTPSEPCNCNALSKTMGLSVSRGSRIIEKLIRNKYIQQETSKTDRRNIILKLAPRGVRVRKKIEEMLTDCENKIESKLSDSEIKNIINLFNKIENCL